jgi:hypothetical protein
LVDVAPAGVTLKEDIAGAGFFSTLFSDQWHAVSADGSRVFFTASRATDSEEKVEEGQLYVREMNQGRAIEVSRSQKTNGNGPGGTDENGPRLARYWDASVDGSKVFFTSKSELTNDANTGPADNAANLYEYDLETGALSDLTVDTNAGDANGASVLGLVTAGDDGSYAYFVAEGQLATGAVPGRPNLYLSHGGESTFIATLAPSNGREATGEERGGDSEDWLGTDRGETGPGQHTVRVTTDGTRLAFESERSLTGYDNNPVEPSDCEASAEGTFGPRPCREVYLYDALSGQLVCASCDPGNARPTGPATLGGHEDVKENFAGIFPFYLPRNFSEDGSRLFFQSPDALVSHDSNGVQDVYEYENGHVYPISDVAGNHSSYFLDGSPNGDDAFIVTADQLLPSDIDTRADLYDVRVAGGLPISVTPPECVNGDSCKGPVSPQPEVFGAPASATFSGAGNVSPTLGVKPKAKAKSKARERRCKKRYVRKRGKCVKQKVRKSSRHSKGRK